MLSIWNHRHPNPPTHSGSLDHATSLDTKSLLFVGIVSQNNQLNHGKHMAADTNDVSSGERYMAADMAVGIRSVWQ